jgi:hypothetical protein
MIHDFVQEVGLSGEDEREEGFGVEFELAEGLDLGQDFKPQKVGFVNDEDRDLFAEYGLLDLGAYGFGEPGDGVGGGVGIEILADLAKDLEV